MITQAMNRNTSLPARFQKESLYEAWGSDSSDIFGIGYTIPTWPCGYTPQTPMRRAH